MTNSTFPTVIGGRNGGNARLANILDTDQLGYAMTPELVFAQTVTWKDLRDATGVAQVDEIVIGGTIVAGEHTLVVTNARTGVLLANITHVVHEDTITIGGTASDGNYDTIFTALDPPVRVRTVRSTTPATNDNIATQHAADITDLIATSLAGIVESAAAVGSVVTIVYEDAIDPQTLSCSETTATGTIVESVSEDEDDIAAALEALIEAYRVVLLADYVTDETVSTDTITVTYEPGVQILITPDFPGTSTGTVTTTNVATIPIGASAGNLFPAAVWVAGDRGAGQNVKVAFAGITTIAAELGDAGDVDGLMTSTTIASTGFTSTIAAAEYAEHMELTYAPVFTVTADELFSHLTAGEVEVLIPYSAPPTI